MKYSELYPKDLRPQKIYCSDCGTNMTLIFDDFGEVVEDIKIILLGLPYLQCSDCKKKFLPDRSRISIIKIFEDTKKAGKKEFKSRRNKLAQKFNFGKVDFKYDPDDYFYIPGLIRDDRDGFLTPVYFNRQVLIKFYSWPGYNISFASRTYGCIEKGQEFNVAFGINSNDKVVMWLGDIAELSDEEQHYLRSENIPSDHNIGSEFYDGQIEAQFTDRPPEDKLVSTWSGMNNAFFKRFGIKSTQLDDETLDLIKDLKRPAVFTEKGNQHIIDVLNKLCTETIDSVGLGKLLQKASIKSDKLGSLKKLQKILEKEFPTEDIYTLLTPYYVLYDLRVSYNHLTPKVGQEVVLKSALARLSLAPETDFKILYEELIKRITLSYEEITKLLES